MVCGILTGVEVAMKKPVIVALALLTLVSVTLFAADSPEEYVVQSVTGKVEREVSANRWEAVVAGMTLAPSAVVNTGLNASLVVQKGDSVIVIKAMQKGPLEKLIASLGAQTAGIKRGSKIKESRVSADSGQAVSNVSTASTRASEAEVDIEWVDSE